MSALTEKLKDGSEIYYSEIHAALDDFIMSKDIEDMKKESQSVWNAALINIYQTVFKGTDKLRKEPYEYLSNNGMTNNNAYDFVKLDNVLDIYIYLCYLYEKEISVKGFCYLTGISKSCIYAWAGNQGYSQGLMNRANSAGVDLKEKLEEENEESLSALLISGKRPPVAILGALNRRHGWNMGQLSADDKAGLPQESREQIAARYAGYIGAGEPEKPDLD